MRALSGILAPALLGALLLAGAARPRADVVELSDGRRVEGRVLSRTAERLELLSNGGRVFLPAERVASVEKSPEWKNLLLEAEYALRRGRLGDAEQDASRARRAGADPDDLRAWCVSWSGLLGQALPGAPVEERALWSALAGELAGLPADAEQMLFAPLDPEDEPASPTLVPPPPGDVPASATLPSAAALDDAGRDYLIAMAEAFEGLEDSPLPAALLTRLDAPGLRRAAERGDLLRTVLLREIKNALRGYDFERASHMIRRLETAGLSGSGPRAYFISRRAEFERRRGRYETACRLLAEELSELYPNIAQTLLRKTLAEARGRLAAAGRHERAVALYERHAAQAGIERTTETLASLYRQWGEDLLENEAYDAATLALEESRRLNPKLDDGPLRLARFEKRFAALGEKDYGSAFELGRWAAENDLEYEALRAYRRATAEERLRPLAEEQITLLREALGAAQLRRAADLLEKGRPEDALEELDRFDFVPNQTRLRAEIERLRSLCHQEISRRLKLRPVQAQLLYQDAERQFYLGAQREARRAMRALVRDYFDTPAGRRAAEFLKEARMRIDIDRLEGEENPEPKVPLVIRPDSALDREVRDLLEALDMTPAEALEPPAAPPVTETPPEAPGASLPPDARP